MDLAGDFLEAEAGVEVAANVIVGQRLDSGELEPLATEEVERVVQEPAPNSPAAAVSG